jgi:hypothetical protein
MQGGLGATQEVASSIGPIRDTGITGILKLRQDGGRNAVKRRPNIQKGRQAVARVAVIGKINTGAMDKYIIRPNEMRAEAYSGKEGASDSAAVGAGADADSDTGRQARDRDDLGMGRNPSKRSRSNGSSASGGDSPAGVTDCGVTRRGHKKKLRGNQGANGERRHTGMRPEAMDIDDSSSAEDSVNSVNSINVSYVRSVNTQEMHVVHSVDKYKGNTETAREIAAARDLNVVDNDCMHVCVKDGVNNCVHGWVCGECLTCEEVRGALG